MPGRDGTGPDGKGPLGWRKCPVNPTSTPKVPRGRNGRGRGRYRQNSVKNISLNQNKSA